ncbi:MAG TPA: 2-dehydropantoate 2-reductase N-terminal domain-containing protein, partial [Polyangiaceae bacterium]|nr:2-dehydropantoate 2-reductase N-terminal domain-containing protein [Polyangiaceae bacterium]
MPRFLVVGAGGIGGVVAAHLAEQGADVTTLTKNPLIADAINAYGFRVRGESGPGTVHGEAVRKLSPKAGTFDYVLLATQPPQVEEAALSVLAHLADGGRMVCFQNGLCEERIAKLVGRDNVIGAVVAWG